MSSSAFDVRRRLGSSTTSIALEATIFFDLAARLATA
jgi:hypothetical protein